MKRGIRLIFFVMAIAYYVGCAPVEFSKDNSCGVNCVSVDGVKTYRYAITPNSGKVDILFIDDNSGSMSPEQNAIASKFSSFINALDARSIDYRIAIATTDTVKNPGQLITFGNGKSFLSKADGSTTQKTTWFANAIRRQETLNCESFLAANPNVSQNSAAYQQNCPSGDERGIKAANLIVRGNPAGFIRAQAHLAVVFLADEDERSQLYDDTPLYRLESDDLPQTLISTVQSTYSGKSVSAHAIIVKPGPLNGVTASEAANKLATVIDANGVINQAHTAAQLFNGGDTVCLNNQYNATLKINGSYGYLYSLAAQMTGGIVGDICAGNYGLQLYDIGENIGEQVSEHQLYCSDIQPIDGSTPLVTFTPSGGTYTISGDRMLFDPNLTPGTQAYLQYSCP